MPDEPVPGIEGMLVTDQQLSSQQAAELVRRWKDAQQRGGIAVLPAGVRYRQRLPDGTFEPDYQAALLETRRDWLPYLIGISGWVVALVAVLVR